MQKIVTRAMSTISVGRTTVTRRRRRRRSKVGEDGEGGGKEAANEGLRQCQEESVKSKLVVLIGFHFGVLCQTLCFVDSLNTRMSSLPCNGKFVVRGEGQRKGANEGREPGRV